MSIFSHHVVNFMYLETYATQQLLITTFNLELSEINISKRTSKPTNHAMIRRIAFTRKKNPAFSASLHFS